MGEGEDGGGAGERFGGSAETLRGGGFDGALGGLEGAAGKFEQGHEGGGLLAHQAYHGARRHLGGDWGDAVHGRFAESQCHQR
jgi:hypothetical protein